MGNNNRIEYISLASVLSAVAVIFLHANECIKDFSLVGFDWISANLIHSVFFPAVPIFFMISGAMLFNFNKKYDLKTYFSKRISKTVIPYIVWSLIGLGFQIFYLNTIKLSDVRVTYVLFGLINGNLVGVYWFFVLLFMFYCLIPIFSSIATNKKYCLYGIIILFIINLIISPPPYKKIAIICYLFYGMVGYYIHVWGISKNLKRVFYVLGILGLLVHLFGTYYLSISAGELVYTFQSYTHVTCIFYAIGLFAFIKYDLVKLMNYDIVNKVVSFLDFYTFGIYLIHWYILKMILKIFSISNTLIYYRLFAPFVVVVVCVIIVTALRKIPLIKNCVP